ncbi:LysE family transporter [Basilea psittacipulmonis]|uniref:Membrane protein n=1 Tax=Basilea psittacipulmonis DSM 24701 TaxID=1072685 RepID=A0A077DF99_9BURK|nr:LysE family transporter [Basilea psittacipulmonis]AIL32796.1 membrane protein [Basilea psittacipulmonis DSM 24701]
MLNLIIIQFFGLLTPGPDFFYVSRVAVKHTQKVILANILGITAGVLFWATLATLGLSLLMHAYPNLHGALMLAGGSYIGYLGVKLINVKNNISDAQAPVLSKPHQSLTKEFLKGLFVNLSNAKAIMYFASVMSNILGDIKDPEHILIALAIIVIETFAYFYLVALLFSRKIAKSFYYQHSRRIDNLAGCIFLCFGIWLIYSGLKELFLLF